MREVIKLNRSITGDLNMYQCGLQDCDPGYSYGPAVRDFFIIHFVKQGKGIFQIGKKTYQMQQNQGFLICPRVVTYYEADLQEPWTYLWVGFHGFKAESYLTQAGISLENPVFTYDKDEKLEKCLEEMVETGTHLYSKSREIQLIGFLYMFISLLIENSDQKTKNSEKKDFYIEKSIEYMEKNYSRKMNILEVSEYIGLDRNYLGAQFKKTVNTTMQNYLIELRINKACEFMQDTSLSIGDIARSVGYEDSLQFSKIFKKAKKISPREYRKRMPC